MFKLLVVLALVAVVHVDAEVKKVTATFVHNNPRTSVLAGRKLYVYTDSDCKTGEQIVANTDVCFDMRQIGAFYVSGGDNTRKATYYYDYGCKDEINGDTLSSYGCYYFNDNTVKGIKLG